jgi:putative addiction module CopG family antidote
MRIDLGAEVIEQIQQRVDEGRYADATAVVREALLLLEEREKLEYLRAALAEARAQVDRGEYVEWTPELMDRLVEESEELYRQGAKPDPDVCP